MKWQYVAMAVVQGPCNQSYSCSKNSKYPLYISFIEMGSLWQGKTYPKYAASLLNRVCVKIEGLHLSKELGKRVKKIQAVKVGDLKKILPLFLSGNVSTEEV